MTVDSLNFLEAVRGLPEQLAAAHEAAGKLKPALLPRADEIDNIVVLGMGGSGIAGDVLAATASGALGYPGDRAQALSHAVLRRAAHVGVRDVVLRRHRGDALDDARRARRGRQGDRRVQRR